jgi:ribonuclease HII
VPLVDVSKNSIKELTELLNREPRGSNELLVAMEADPRAGVRNLAKRTRARLLAEQKELERLDALWQFEREVWRKGFTKIAGTDEVGVGPLAGPVVAAAVILPRDFEARGINDSKQVEESERDRLAEYIRTQAIAWALGQAEVHEIDQINILQASLLAMERAIRALKVAPDYLLIDARELKTVALPQQGIIKGDARSVSIAAASILAKTHRDALMVTLDAKFPGYGLAKHKGYPVPEHLEALKRLGPCELHRRSFAPVREVLGSQLPLLNESRREGKVEGP